MASSSWNCCVSRDHYCECPTGRFQAERISRDIDRKALCECASKKRTVDCEVCRVQCCTLRCENCNATICENCARTSGWCDTWKLCLRCIAEHERTHKNREVGVKRSQWIPFIILYPTHTIRHSWIPVSTLPSLKKVAPAFDCAGRSDIVSILLQSWHA